MARRARSLVVSAALSLILLALLLPLPSRSQTASPLAAQAAAAHDGLIVTTSGSAWAWSDTYPAYQAFAAYGDRLDVITRVPVQQVLQQHADLHMVRDDELWFDVPVAPPLPQALVVDLQGTSDDYPGLNVLLYLIDAQDRFLEAMGRTSARGLHLDQPTAQTYRVLLQAYGTATCTLEIGTGQSPFLTTPLDDYSFLLFPDSGPLSDRELARIQQFVQEGGNLVVLGELLEAPRYHRASNFDALNELLEGCGMQFTGQLLTTTLTTTANNQTISILTDVRPHALTEGIDEVASTGSTLSLSGTAQGLVFDDQGDPVMAVSRMGRGQCLAIGTGVAFDTDFHLRQNDPLAANIIEWASVRGSYVIYLPVVRRG